LAKKKLVHYTTFDARKRANAAFLVGAYSVSQGDCLWYDFKILWSLASIPLNTPPQRTNLETTATPEMDV